MCEILGRSGRQRLRELTTIEIGFIHVGQSFIVHSCGLQDCQDSICFFQFQLLERRISMSEVIRSKLTIARAVESRKSKLLINEFGSTDLGRESCFLKTRVFAKEMPVMRLAYLSPSRRSYAFHRGGGVVALRGRRCAVIFGRKGGTFSPSISFALN